MTSTFKRQLRSVSPCRGGAFCRGKGDMIALTAPPPQTASAVFGVRVGTVGDYKGVCPIDGNLRNKKRISIFAKNVLK